jgi:hypothetical protein
MNEELNRKLAEWALKKVPCELCMGGDFKALDGTMFYGIYDLPEFTESLDACFRWLVPKLSVRIDQMFGSWVGWAKIKGTSNWQSGVNKGSPALALCLAIEKLIDSEKK